MHVLVTGAAGFIGHALSQALLRRGDTVLGIDNLSTYYDVRLKQARLDRLTDQPRFRFELVDVAARDRINALFATHKFDAVVHLAAQAGVRYSLTNPHAYVDANIVGFLNVLEGVRHHRAGHLVFASSSSVYGANAKLPFSERDNVDHPVSLYAATKKANELMAHSYAHLYGLRCTGLRFFTVYGPWGRPDMALFIFTKAILAGRPLPVFNQGNMVRDFTYVDDIVEGIVRVIGQPAAPAAGWSGDRPDPATSYAPWRIFNIGNNRPVKLMRYIEVLEQCLGKKARLELLPMQAGDVPATCADTGELQKAVGYKPETPVEIGVKRFAEWYQAYYRETK
jgi:UDP-glucuronate 4-epimerase